MKARFCHIIFIGWLLVNPLWGQTITIDGIEISGNKRSRASVIMRELTFAPGDTLSLAALQTHLEESRNNILNTSLFNYVTLTADTTALPAVGIHIKVEERWYIWPSVDLIFEDRNISTWLRHPDWSRFTLGAGVNIQNMRGLNETLRFNARVGYQRGLSLSYSNITIDRAKKHLLSLSAGYNIVYNAAYQTEGNKPVYVTIDGNPLRERYSAGLSYLYRPRINERHNASIDISRTNIDDTLLTLNPHFWGGTKAHRSMVNLTYSYTVDHRDSYIYPLKGNVLKAIVKTGIALDDDYITTSVYPQFGVYVPLAKRLFYAGEAFAKVTALSKRSYIEERALGYDGNYLRGYEDYVVDGNYFLLSKNTLRFLLLPTKVIEIKWLSALSKFNKIHFTIYANVFADFGYAYHQRPTAGNTFENKFLYSGGAGLDLVTYYDIVFRVDYAVNKLGDGGVFITLITPFF